ncbi:MAG: VTT domain-containing protein [Candidatus Eisenbacteria bacterium]
MKRLPPVRLLLFLSFLLLFVAGIRFLPIGSWGEAMLRWVAGAGPLGPPALAAMFIVVCVFALPGLPLTLGGGFFFGFPGGFFLVMAGTSLGSAVAFGLGRTVARPWVVRWGSSRPKLVALDRAVGRRGLLLVMLSRLSPFFPYNLLTYGYSITRVPMRTFLVGSVIGVAPVTAFYVYAGTVMKSVADVAAGRVEASEFGITAPLAAVGATAAALLVIARVAGREMERALRKDDSPSA